MDACVVPPEWNAVLNVWNAHMGVGAGLPGHEEDSLISSGRESLPRRLLREC